MSKQCTKPIRKRDDSWFKDKVLLVQTQASGQILHEEELAFLADPRIPEAQATQTVITHNTAYQADIWIHMTLIVMNSTLPKFLSWRIYLIMVMPSSEQSNATVQNSNSSTQQDELILSVIEQLKTQVANCFQNPLKKAQQLEPKLYVGDIIEKTNPIVIPDSEETLMLAEESRSKMLLKQKDPIMLEKKVNTTPVDYARLSNFIHKILRPTIVDVQKELPKVSMVNTSLKNLKHHLAGFDVVVKERTTPTAIIEGSWGFEHTKACFRDEIIPFVKALKDLINTFNQYLIDATFEFQNVFHQYGLGNTKKDKIRQTPSSTQKNKVEAHPRKVKSSLKNKDCVVQPKGTAHVHHFKLNANSELKCVKCDGCMLSDNHDLCVPDYINNVNARKKSKYVNKSSKRKVWKPTGKVITTTTEVPLRKPTALENETPKPVVTLVYSRKPRKSKTNVPVSKSNVLKSISANKKEPSKSWGSIVSDVPSSSLNECRSSKLFSVKFGNDHVAKILGYGDYQIGNVTISRVYYVEGLGHNLFSVGQFCDSNLEVAFRQHTCFIRNLEGVDLLTGSRGNNLYTLSLGDMMASSPICLLSKASKTKSKDEAPDFIIKFLKMIQVRLKVPVRRIRTDNGTKFVNHTLREYYEKVDISHEVFICVYVGYVRFGNQSIERDRLIGIGFVLDFVEFISFTFGDKEMIL
ncbi:integrase, catalytic region, zinc finger, CCHC-type containing protein [Tanacetum coccineum]